MTTKPSPSVNVEKPFEKMTPTFALQLAAPHTWPASVIPVLLGYALSCALGNWCPSTLLTLCCLFIAILMQSSVNTFNDYFDYKKGLDSIEDNLEESDSTLVYHHLKPSSALKLAIGFLVVAFAFGAYIVVRVGIKPLIIGIIGALFVVLYSAGKKPLCNYPVGEFVSGFVMGGLITLATFVTLYTHQLDFIVITSTWDTMLMVLACSVPCIIAIGLIMLTNNTCDIEKDQGVNRRTMAVRLGREKSVKIYHGCMVAWALSIIAIVGIWFWNGLLVLFIGLIVTLPTWSGLWKSPLTPQTRIMSMKLICSLNVILGLVYVAAILASIFTLTF